MLKMIIRTKETTDIQTKDMEVEMKMEIVIVVTHTTHLQQRRSYLKCGVLGSFIS